MLIHIVYGFLMTKFYKSFGHAIPYNEISIYYDWLERVNESLKIVDGIKPHGFATPNGCNVVPAREISV
jgi:hypothetical protein